MNDIKRLEVTEEVLLEGADRYVKGAVEVFDLSDPAQKEIHDKWKRFGWAKDFDTGETGERKPGAVSLQPDDVVTLQPDNVLSQQA